MAKNLIWVFVSILMVLYIFGLTASAAYNQWRSFLDPIFWLSFVGMFVCYFWYKRSRKNA